MIEIRHVGIYVKDLEVMKNFYVQMLGMQEKVHEIEKSAYISTILGLEQAEIELYKLTADNGAMIELLKAHNMEVQDERNSFVWEQGNQHIAISVLNIEEDYNRLTRKGIRFISAPCISPNGYAKVCFCKDPEGNYIELVEVL